MAFGRPTIYNDDLLEAARRYVADYKDEGHLFPSIAGLARVLHCSRETIHAWCRDTEKQVFSDIIKELMAEQELVLAQKGLAGEFNSTITKLLLTKHDYSDKVDNTLSAPGGGPVEWAVQPVKPVDAKD